MRETLGVSNPSLQTAQQNYQKSTFSTLNDSKRLLVEGDGSGGRLNCFIVQCFVQCFVSMIVFELWFGIVFLCMYIVVCFCFFCDGIINCDCKHHYKNKTFLLSYFPFRPQTPPATVVWMRKVQPRTEQWISFEWMGV